LWFPDWGWSRIGLSAVVLLGAASLVFGAFEQRKQAEAMELLWHRMGDPPDAASLLAGSPQTERRPDPEDLIPTPE
jgi:hypothetical protein